MKYLIYTLLLPFELLQAQPKNLNGAWINESSEATTVRIYTDGFFSVATFSSSKFIATYGGSYKVESGKLTETIEFHTVNPELIGTSISLPFKIHQKEFSLGEKQTSTTFALLDGGTPGNMAGAWLITGRYQDGTMNSITPGARRTMKILSGSRFQWIAYNVATKEFLGTGGGTYTSENGKYIEKIDFFSRDQSRVGISLGFDYTLQNDGSWRHMGKSSKGDPIDEVWTQREKLGL